MKRNMVDSLSITIPAYNEQETIKAVIGEAINAAKNHARLWEILIIDDGSTDNTDKILTRLKKTTDHLRVIKHKTNQGFTGAIGDCYRYAKNDLVFFAPADGQFDFSELPRFLKAIKNADVVFSSRELSNVNLHRRINTFLFRSIYHLLFALPFQDVSSCILWKKKVLDRINVTSHKKSATISVEMAYKTCRLGYKIVEVPISWHKRRGGEEKGGNPFIALWTLVEMIKLWLKLKT